VTVDLDVEFKKGTQNSFVKARRLLIEGRISIVGANAVKIQAKVRGDSEGHISGYDQGWYCSCRAGQLGKPCSHVKALQLIWSKS
jgi:hypothetical protein